MEHIPEAVFRPTLQSLGDVLDSSIIIIDVETTAGSDAELTQIAALSLTSDESFSQYILPKGPISKIAQDITGLSVRERSGHRFLSLHGVEVESSSLSCVLNEFCSWMRRLIDQQIIHGKGILVGHNARSFDMRQIVKAFKSCGMQDDLTKVVAGFGDTLPYVKQIYKGKVSSFRQSVICNEILGITYDAHNAESDTSALKSLLVHSLQTQEGVKLSGYCWSIESVFSDVQYLVDRASKFRTLKFLCTGNSKVVSKDIALKIAGSGLSYRKLKRVYDRYGADGLAALMGAKVNGRVRVTTKKNIINAICEHFQKTRARVALSDVLSKNK